MDLEIGGLNQGGVIYDVSPFELGPQFFTDVLNIDFTKDGMRPLPAPAELDLTFDFEVKLAVEAFSQGGIRMILLLGDSVVKILFQDEFYDVTPEGFSGVDTWSYTHYNGYVVLATGIDFPLYFDFLDPFSALKLVPHWPQTVIPRFISSYAGFLFGFGNVITGTFSEQVCLWSDLAEIGSLPDNFNFADPASRAGITTLEGTAVFVAAVPLGNSLIVYRSADIYLIRFIGGNSIFSFSQIFSDKSLLTNRALATKGRLQYCIGDNQFYVHDGISEQTFDAKPVSDFFFTNLNRDAVSQISVIYDRIKDKLHILFPFGDSEFCNKDLFYNFNTGTWSLADIPDSTFATILYYPKAEYNASFDDLVGTFDQWQGDYRLNYPDVTKPDFLYFGNSLYSEKDATGFRYCYAKRTLVAYTTQDQNGGVTVARNKQVLLTDVWPKMEDGTLRMRLGYAPSPTGTVAWQPWLSLTHERENIFCSGVYLNLELDNQVIDSSGGISYSNFCFNGYMLTAKPLGDR